MKGFILTFLCPLWYVFFFFDLMTIDIQITFPLFQFFSDTFLDIL